MKMNRFFIRTARKNKQRAGSKPRKSSALAGSIAMLVGSFAAMLTAPSTEAATYYWDSNSTTAGFGNTGTWGTNAFWTTDSTGAFGAAGVTATNSADIVNIGTNSLTWSGTTLAITGNVTVNSIVFGSAQTAITLGAATNTITLAGTTPTITVNGASTSQTIAAIVAGSAGLIKDGAGTLVMSAANTYTGGLVIRNGTINAAANANTVGGATNTISMGGAGSSGATLIGNTTINRALTVNAPTSGVVTLAPNTSGNSLTYSGAITLNGDLTVRAFFNTTSAGTGNTTVSGGITGTGNLILNNTGNGAGITTATSKIVISGTAINPTGSITARGDNAGATALTTISGNIGTNVTSLTKEGIVKLVLSGTNTFTGDVNITSGTVELGSAGALNGQNAVAFTSASTGTLALNSRSVTISNLSTHATPGTTFVQNGHASTAATLTVGNAQNLSGTYAGIIQNGAVGALALTKAGTGTLTLNGKNTFTGNVNITGGTLVANVAATGADTALGNAANTRTVTVGTGANLRFDVANVLSTNFSTSAVPSLLITGTATNNIAGNNALGNITLTGGTLTATAGHADYGAFNINGTITSTGTSLISASGGAVMMLTSSGANNVDTANTVDVQSGTLTISAPLGQVTTESKISGLTKIGAGDLILSNANTFTGATRITGGTLGLSGTGTINSTSGIEISGSGAKFLHAGSVAVTPVVTLNQGTLTGSGTVNAVNVADTANAIVSNNDGVAGAALTIGTLTFNGAATVNTFSSTTSAPIIVTTLATTSGTVTLNASSASWTTGTPYDLISYTGGSIGGAGFTGRFAVGTVSNTSVRQTKTLLDSGTAVTLTVGANDTPVWSGAGSTTWTTATFGDNTGPNAWALKTAQTATNFWAGDDVEFNDTYNLGAGDVTVTNTTATITGGVAPTTTTFNNSVVNYTIGSSDSTGITSGSLFKNGTNMVTITTNNTYTGATVINAGTILINGIGTLGTGSALTLAGGNLDLGNTSQTVGTVSITAPAGSGDTISNGSLTGTSYAASNTAGNVTISANLLGSVTFAKSGAGTVTLSGANTYSGITTIGGGTLSLTGSLSNAGLGNVVVQAGATLNVSGTLSGSTSATSLTFGSVAGVANVNVSSGANLTIASNIGGANASAVSVYNQTGGSVTVGTAGTGEAVTLASLGYGYMNISGGSYSVLSRYSVENGNPGQGVLRVGGGAGAATFSANDLLAIGRGASGTGELTVLPNGTVTFNGTGTVNMLLNGNSTNNTGILNIVGGTFSSPVKPIAWGNGTSTNGTLGMVNLGAGTLEIGANFTVNVITTAGTNKGFVNFAGGTLKYMNTGLTQTLLPASNVGFNSLANTIFGAVTNSTANNDGTGGASGISGTVGTTQDFIGGVTIDTNGFASNTISVPLVAPTGGGVAQGNLSIIGGTGYVAPPTVNFSAPAAANATAAAGYALVSGGQVVGIVITAPGSYASTDTVTVTFTGGGGTGASVASISGTSLAANTSGGLTVIGGGNLTLSGASSFTDGLRIKNGTVTATTSATSLGAATNIVTLGDTTGSANATLSIGNTASINYAQPIVVAAGSSGIKKISGGANAVSPTGTITLNDSLTISPAGANMTFTSTAVISGGVGKDLTISATGAGLYVPQAQNTYAGNTRLVAGTAVANSDSTGSASTANLTSGPFGTGILSFEGGSMRPTSGVTGNTIGNAVEISANITFAPGITNTLTFNGPVTLTGTGTTRTVTYAQTGGTIAFAGNIGDGGGGNGITIGATTTGTFQFFGSNTYTGATTVSIGTLAIGSTGSLANTAIAVSSTGNFAVAPGAGTVNLGNTSTVGAGASLNLGSGGTFSMVDGAIGITNLVQEGTFASNALTLNGAILNFELSGATADKLAVTGALAIASVTGVITINLTALAALNNGTYDFITTANPAGGLDSGGPSAFAFASGLTTGVGGFGGTNYLLTLNNAAAAASVTVAAAPSAMTWTGQVLGNGATDFNWTTGANTNWALGATPIGFANGNAVTFQDTNTVAGGNVAAPSLAVVIQPGGVTPGSTTFNNSAVDYTVSGGAIGGTGGLTKTGTGTVALANTSNYSGITTVNGGILAGAATNAFSANSAYVIGASGTLAVNGFAQTIGSLEGVAGAIVTNGAASGNVALTAGGNNTSTPFAGNLVDGSTATLGLTKVGTGTLTITGSSNTLTGNTVVANGTLNISGTGSLTGNTNSTSLSLQPTVSGNSAIVNYTSSATSTFFTVVGANVAGTASVLNQTDGLIQISPNTTTGIQSVVGVAGAYGAYNISGGTFRDTTGVSGGSRFTVGNVGTASATNGTIAGVRVGIVNVSGTGFIDHTNAEWWLNYSLGQINVTDSGKIDHTGSNAPFAIFMDTTVVGGSYGVLNVAGTGAQVITGLQPVRFGNNTTNGHGNSGFVNLAAGTLSTGTIGNTSLPAAPSATNYIYYNYAGGTLKASNTLAAGWTPTSGASATVINTLFGAIDNIGAANDFAGGLTVDTDGNPVTIPNNQPLLGATGVGVTQANLTVGGGSGYISAPSVTFSRPAAANGVAASGYAIVSGGSVTGIVITDPGVYAASETPTIILLGGFATGAGTAATATSSALATNNTSGGLTKIGAGTLTLSGTGNTYSGGTTVSVGTLALGVNGGLPTNGNLTVNSTGTFNAATFTNSVGTVSLQGSGTITGSTGVITSNAAYDLRSGTVNFTGTGGLAGSVGLNKSTGGTVTLSGATSVNSFTGALNVTGGTLSFSTGNHLGDATSVTNTLGVSAGSTLQFTNAGAVNLGVNRVLTVGAGGAILETTQSTGELTLPSIAGASTGNLTKTGAGSIVIDGSISLNAGAGAVTVSDGKLTASFGSGGVDGITVGATGNLSFQNATATALAGLTSLTLNGGGRLGFDVAAPGTNDSLALDLASTLTISGVTLLDFANIGGLTIGNYTLIDDADLGLSLANFTVGSVTGFSGFLPSLSITGGGQNLVLSISAFVPIYWDISGAGSWATATNWSTDLAGTTPAASSPVFTDTVVFSSVDQLTTTAFTTTLDGSYTVNGIQFTAQPATVAGITIAEGTGGTLTISPSSTISGIEVLAGSGNNVISAPVVAGASQTWAVDSSGSLSLSGKVTFTGAVNKTGGGALTLSGTGNDGAASFTLTGGTLNLGSNDALSTGTFIVGTGTTIDATGGARTLNNGAQTWNGSFAFAGANNLDMGTGAVTLGGNVGILASGSILTVGGAIDDGASTFGLSKAGAGTLVLNGANAYDGLTDLVEGTLTLAGNNSGAAGGVTMAASTTLYIGHNAAGTTNALGTGTFSINGGTIDNTSGSAITANGGNNLQNWNGNFIFNGSNNLNLGTGAVTLGATTQIITTANTLTVGGAIGDGVNAFGITKAGAGTLSLGASNAYEGATIIDQGTLAFTANQSLTAATNNLTFGSTNASTNAVSLDLSTASATFGGAMLVQTDTATANTINLGSAQTLTINGGVTIGAGGTGTSSRLNVTGTGTAEWIVSDGGATFRVGNNSSFASTNTLDMTGLAKFTADVANFRVGSSLNDSGLADTNLVILAVASTITANFVDVGASTESDGISTLRLNTGLTTINANTIAVGASNNAAATTDNQRSDGTINFLSPTGTLIIRAANGTGAAAMNIANHAGTVNAGTTGLVDLNGHSSDLLLSTVQIGRRATTDTATTTSAGGTLSFNTGTLTATTVNMGFRGGDTLTTGGASGTLNLGGGTVAITTLNMSTNNATVASTTGDSTSTLNISGSGTNTFGTIVMGLNTVVPTATGSDTIATIAITGGTTTVNTAFTMGAQNSVADAAITVNTATSTLNISAGSLTLAGSTNLTMGTTTLDANNAATATINLTGSGSLTVGGNIQYTNGTGLETNTINLNGATALLDMTGGNIGATGALITFTARQGTLQNLAELNGGGTLTKTGTAGVDNSTNVNIGGTNAYTGAVTIDVGSITALTSSALGTGTKTITITNGTAGNSNLQLDGSGGDISLSSAFTYNTSNANNNGTIINVTGNNTLAGQINMTGGGGNTALNVTGGSLNVSANITATTTGRFLDLRGTGAGTVSGNITESGANTFGLNKLEAGTWTLSGSNTYTGATTVNAGTLAVTGSLSGTTQVNVNNGGALLLNASVANNPLNSGAAVTVGGGTSGTLSMQGVSGSTGTLAGALNLSSNSAIDFGTGDSNTLTFASLASLGGTNINIFNWTGSQYAQGFGITDTAPSTQDRLVFSSGLGGTYNDGDLFSQINFYADSGSTLLGFGQAIAYGSPGGFEIVPVPEPATTALIGAVALCALINYRGRRRIFRKSGANSAF